MSSGKRSALRYLHAVQAARSKHYELRLIVDVPGQALREDLTGMHV